MTLWLGLWRGSLIMRKSLGWGETPLRQSDVVIADQLPIPAG